eukprot:2719837-Amphidinium_carterae.1
MFEFISTTHSPGDDAQLHCACGAVGVLFPSQADASERVVDKSDDNDDVSSCPPVLTEFGERVQGQPS